MPNRHAGLRGKLPAKPPVMGFLKDYADLGSLRHPATFDRASDVADYPMALNDQIGDCTIAGVVHMLQLMYAEIGEVFAYPGDTAVRNTYFDMTGGADSGLVITDVLSTWMHDGLFGTKIAAYAPVDIATKGDMKAACWLFGALYLGVEMPANAETEFEEHRPWSPSSPPGQPVGGHCIVGTGASRLGQDIITWGATTSMTWSWWKDYGSEAYVVIPEVWVEADHGPVPNIDIAKLREDLNRIQ